MPLFKKPLVQVDSRFVIQIFAPILGLSISTSPAATYSNLLSEHTLPGSTTQKVAVDESRVLPTMSVQQISYRTQTIHYIPSKRELEIMRNQTPRESLLSFMITVALGLFVCGSRR